MEPCVSRWGRGYNRMQRDAMERDATQRNTTQRDNNINMIQQLAGSQNVFFFRKPSFRAFSTLGSFTLSSLRQFDSLYLYLYLYR